MKIVLLRHAESTDNKSDILGGESEAVLTSIGEEQSRKVGNELNAKYVFTKCFSSPRKRCLMTTDIVIKELNNKPRIEVKDILTERDFGVFTGKPMREIDFNLLDNLERENKYMVETIEEMKDRIINFIDFLKQTCNKEDVILVVTHSNPIRAFRMVIENLTFKEVIESKNVGNAEFVEYEI